MPEILKGLEVSEYRHKDDEKALRAVEKVLVAKKLGEWLEEIERKYSDRIEFLGTNVKLTEKSAPRIIRLLEEAKQVLDYSGDIEVFSWRSYAMRVEVVGVEKAMIKLSDNIIRNFSDEMILFLFGQAITMVKGGMLKLFQLSNVLSNASGLIPVAGRALMHPVGQFRRKAQLTIDRGGLLACQDYETVMKHFCLLSGVPFRMLDEVDIQARMEQISNSLTNEKSFGESVGKLNSTLFNERRAWNNERFIETFNWYNSGEYGRIIQAHI